MSELLRQDRLKIVQSVSGLMWGLALTLPLAYTVEVNRLCYRVNVAA